ncbi:MAG: type III pantothenate kinase [Flavobacteriales bacterium]|nr:type III pantothenate kinase [Flavobacteriales bacterium]
MARFLLIDQGNTRCKWFLVNNKEWSDIQYASFVSESIEVLPDADHCILSSTKHISEETIQLLENKYRSFILLKGSTPLPLENAYLTQLTLGPDRIANAAAASAIYPNKHVLIIDVGTCITYDFVHATDGFLGGSISPGIHLRIKAMNGYTDKLPLVEPVKNPPLVGESTEQALQSGAVNGIIAETLGTIEFYRSQYPSLLSVITGGDAHHFDNHLKSTIFADSKFTFKGLLEILKFHVT